MSGRISPSSRGYALCRANSLPSSSRTHCDSTFFVSSSCTDFMFWKSPIPHAQLLLQLNDVALEETNDCCTSHSLQPGTCLPDGPPKLSIHRVHVQALPRCMHRISCSLKFSFRSGVSTPTSPWSPSFLRWDPQFSGPHDGCGKCGFHVVYTAVSRRVYLGRLPTAVATSC